MNYLVVSSDAYNAAFGDRRVIAVEVDSRSVYQGTYRATANPSSTPALHCLTGWSGLPEAGMLKEQVAELHPERHAARRAADPEGD